MLQPRTLTEAFEQARLQEQTISAVLKRSKVLIKHSPGTIMHNNYKGLGSTPYGKINDTSRIQTKSPAEKGFVNRQLFEQRRAVGLCYKCGDKYDPGHQCKSQMMNSIHAYQEVTEIFDEETLQGTEEEVEPGSEEEGEMGLSVHALSAADNQDTIKIKGGNGRKSLAILVDTGMYSRTLEEHAGHLRRVLEVLRTNQLFAKQTKCFFGQQQVDYLGYVITAQGVSIDESKVEAMLKWPTPKTVRDVRGFLGLTGYYRKFVKSRPRNRRLDAVRWAHFKLDDGPN
uniref:Reverse transcriptase domain-containing protein n=1 Tax=Ananas comosus var. bracteatus TaxID=296719 RepID=A0A6V7PKV1_ANACO|nr:unnamed protein product [Ananas comosus var. bracteatus]